MSSEFSQGNVGPWPVLQQNHQHAAAGVLDLDGVRPYPAADLGVVKWWQVEFSRSEQGQIKENGVVVGDCNPAVLVITHSLDPLQSSAHEAGLRATKLGRFHQASQA